jgi:hypothetical protein
MTILGAAKHFVGGIARQRQLLASVSSPMPDPPWRRQRVPAAREYAVCVQAALHDTRVEYELTWRLCVELVRPSAPLYADNSFAGDDVDGDRNADVFVGERVQQQQVDEELSEQEVARVRSLASRTHSALNNEVPVAIQQFVATRMHLFRDCVHAFVQGYRSGTADGLERSELKRAKKKAKPPTS